MTSFDLLLLGSVALFLAGLIKGFVGLGLPTASLAMLTLFIDPRMAISMILMPMCVANIWQTVRGEPLGVIAARYWRFALVLGVSVALTVWLSQSTADKVLTFLLGLFVLVFVLMSWRNRVPDISPRWLRPVEIGAAAFAGVLGGLTAAWAAPMAMYLSARGVGRDEFVQASGFLITAGSLPLMVTYLAVGHADMSMLGLSTTLLVPTFAGYGLGEAMRKRADPGMFKRILLLVFLALGTNLIWQSLAGG